MHHLPTPPASLAPVVARAQALRRRHLADFEDATYGRASFVLALPLTLIAFSLVPRDPRFGHWCSRFFVLWASLAGSFSFTLLLGAALRTGAPIAFINGVAEVLWATLPFWTYFIVFGLCCNAVAERWTHFGSGFVLMTAGAHVAGMLAANVARRVLERCR